MPDNNGATIVTESPGVIATTAGAAPHSTEKGFRTTLSVPQVLAEPLNVRTGFYIKQGWRMLMDEWCILVFALAIGLFSAPFAFASKGIAMVVSFETNILLTISLAAVVWRRLGNQAISFYHFVPNPKKLLWMNIYALLFALSASPLVASSFLWDSFASNDAAQAIVRIATIVVLLFYVPLAIWLGISWAFVYYLLLDRAMTLREMLAASFNLVNKGWWSIFSFLFLTALLTGVMSGLTVVVLGLLLNMLLPQLVAIGIAKAVGGTLGYAWFVCVFAVAYADIWGLPEDGQPTVAN